MSKRIRQRNHQEQRNRSSKHPIMNALLFITITSIAFPLLASGLLHAFPDLLAWKIANQMFGDAVFIGLVLFLNCCICTLEGRYTLGDTYLDSEIVYPVIWLISITIAGITIVFLL